MRSPERKKTVFFNLTSPNASSTKGAHTLDHHKQHVGFVGTSDEPLLPRTSDESGSEEPPGRRRLKTLRFDDSGEGVYMNDLEADLLDEVVQMSPDSTPHLHHTILKTGVFFTKEVDVDESEAASVSSICEEANARMSGRHRTSMFPRLLRSLTRLEDEEPLVFGTKTIGYSGSVIFLVNQIFGTGILSMPHTVLVSGWGPALLANCVIGFSAMLTAIMCVRSMSFIKGNRRFDRRVEYISTLNYWIHDPVVRLVLECAFYLSTVTMNISSIVVMAQSLDRLFVLMSGHTVVLTFLPAVRLGFNASDVDGIYGILPNESAFGVSLGYLVNALIAIPLSLWNLDDTMSSQFVSFGVLVFALVQISLEGLDRILSRGFPSTSDLARGLVAAGTFLQPPRIPSWWQNSNAIPLLTGNTISCYSFCNTIPSWANEAVPDVDHSHCIVVATSFSILIYFGFGFALAFAFPGFASENILQDLLRVPGLSLATRLAVYCFNLLTVLPGILVYSITVRYNLVNTGRCTDDRAFLVGSVMPFTIAWMMQNDAFFAKFNEWSSLLFSVSVNFLAPLLAYYVASRFVGQLLNSTLMRGARNFTIFEPLIAEYKPGMEPIRVVPNKARRSPPVPSGRPIHQIQTDMRSFLEALESEELDPQLIALLRQSSEMRSSEISLSQLSAEIMQSNETDQFTPLHMVVNLEDDEYLPAPSMQSKRFE
ncbi:MAG: hypothetical protein KVP17_000387 [Porospora cf. gigantea B]|uniref:uncharacterized protein n=2 Tax=Porospora cf. gigantea B TaxID=2853592 RepID=UPI003571EB30|nr:MAG: hypothetical protein KVP17_000387 [Porospora cf. gigantea B]